MRGACSFLLAALLWLPFSVRAADVAVETLYATHCAQCHGADRLGLVGPALLPENLKRLRKRKAAATIADGRPATQMPPFGDKLSREQIEALVKFIYTPLAEIPTWGMEQILASHVVTHPYGSLPDRPVFDADPLNLFLVVELGDHHVSVLDGDRFEPIHRFQSRFALHGGPKYAQGGRYVYFASRDGWITKYDLWNLKVVAEVRAGINTRNIAVDPDGRWVAVGNYLPHNVTILDGRDLKPVKVIETRGVSGQTSRVSAVYDATPRQSFILALKDIPEVWEIAYGPDAPARFGGWQHDYHPESGDVFVPSFTPRRIYLDDHLDDFFFDQDYLHLIGAARNGREGQVIDMDLGRKIASIPLDGMPHLGSGITFDWQGRRVMATPHLKEGKITVIDMENWQVVKEIKTLGPGFFMRSHKNSPYAWVDVFFGPHKDKVHVIDKRSLEIVKTLQPAPGKVAAHVEFDREGKHALLSIWDMDGAVIVYDADTLEEIKRLPMKKPSGKYNVYNKITRAEGTSH